MNKQVAQIAYVLVLIGMVAVGLTYDVLTRGLAAPTETGPFFCRKLRSSGGDDSAMVFAFVVFSVPLLLRLWQFRRRVYAFEVIIVWTSACIASLSLFISSLDCASKFYTAFIVPDPLLAFALLALPSSIFLVTVLRAMKQKNPVR